MISGPSAGGLCLVADSNKLVLEVPGIGCLVLTRPIVTSWDLSVAPQPRRCRDVYTGDTVGLQGPRRVECDLHLVAQDCREAEGSLLRSRLADDLTVRELLAAINRKLTQREQRK